MSFAFAIFCGCVITVMFVVIFFKFVVPVLDRVGNSLDNWLGGTK